MSVLKNNPEPAVADELDEMLIEVRHGRMSNTKAKAAIQAWRDREVVKTQVAENHARPGYKYLSKEIKKERKSLYEQLQNKNLTPLLHAQLDDVYRWFEARIAVAKLLDNDRIAAIKSRSKE